MDLQEAIWGRRSVRNYTSKMVTDEEIVKIIEAGTWAPSACNIQGWRFIIIDEKEKLDLLVKNGAAAFLKNVNQAILILYNNQTDNTMYQDYIQSAAACIENMCLTAYAMGIGTCWVNFLPAKVNLRKIFEIPSAFDPIALISLGYNAKPTRTVPRKYDVHTLISKNKFCSNDYTFAKKSRTKLFFKRLLRNAYLYMPFKRIVTPILKKVEKTFDN